MINATIQQNLQAVRHRIYDIAKECGRSPEEIRLLAVSKNKSVKDIAAAMAAGQYCFGENYAQEGIHKIRHLAPQAPKLEWHFIGPLQSNKSRLVAAYFDWIHTIDRLQIAQRLSAQRLATQSPLNILIQINISDENSKSGIALHQLDTLASQIVQLPNLRLRGLMAIPAPETDPVRQYDPFTPMKLAWITLRQQYPQVDTLSLGMSHDMAAAIKAGSTLVRIGTAIFGARDHSAKPQ